MSELVTGRLVLPVINKGEEYATIELPPVDTTKFKEGDRVWVECVIGYLFPRENALASTRGTYKFKDIIAHFPAPETECKLPEKYPKEGNELRDSMCLNKLAKNVNQIIDYLQEKEKKA